MANDFRIVISGAVLDKKAYQDIIKGLKSFGDSLKIPINVDTTKLNKAVQSIKLIANEQGEITQSTQKYNVELGKTLVLKTKIRNAIDAEGKLVKDINGNLVKEEITTSEILINQKEINKEKEKELQNIAKIRQQVKTLQGEYWQGRFKDSIQNMTQNPEGIKQLNNYYKQLEAQLGTVEQAQKKVNKSQAEYWANRRKETIQSMTQKPQELQDMAKYYSLMEKESASVEKLRVELKKLQENAITTNNVLKNFGEHRLHEKANQIVADLKKLNITQDMTQKEMQETINKAKQLSNSLANVSKEAKSTGNHSMTLSKMISTAAEKFSIWVGVSTLFYGSFRVMQDAVGYVVNLDNALNSIRIVTGQTQEQVNVLAHSYNQLAKEMGVTTNQIAQQAVELYRQGLSANQVNERMQAIIKYAKISGIELAEANKIITATMNSMGTSAEKTIDIFSMLGDISASGPEEIGEGIQKAGAAMASLNVSLEKMASWFATISSQTRENASIIGNSLKSLATRYTQIREKGFSEEDATNINMVTKALREAGIVAVNGEGQLRNFADVMDELGTKWDSLDDKTKNYIATQMAGVYQANRFKALMNDYGQSMEYYTQALNSAGIANEKFAIWQESASSKIEKFKANLESLFQNTLSSGFIKFIIELGTAFVGLVDSIGIANIALVALGGYIGSKFLLIIPGLTKLLINLGVSLVNIGVSAGTAATAMSALSVALPIAGILLAIGIFDKLYVSLEEQRQKITELTQEYDSLKSEIEKLREIETPNAEQQKYLTLLERELDLKERLLKTEIGRTARREVLGTGVFGEGLSSRISTDIGAIEGLGQRKARLENQLLSIDIDKDPAKFEKIKSQLDFVNEQINKVELSLIKSKKTIEDYKDKLGKETPKEFDNLLNKIDEALPKIQAYNIDIKDNTEATKENADAQSQYTNQTEKFNKQIEESAQNVDFLNRALDELSEYHSLSGDTLAKLVDKYPDLVAYLNDENKLREQLKIKIKEETDIFKKSIQDKIINSEGFLNTVLSGNKQLKNELVKIYGNDVENFKNFNQLKEKANALLIKALGEQWAKYYSSQTDALQAIVNAPMQYRSFSYIGKGVYTPEQEKNLQALKTTLEDQASNAQVLLNVYREAEKKAGSIASKIDIGGKAGGSTSKSGSGGTSNSTKEEYKAIANQYLALELAITKTNNALDVNKALLSNTKDEQKKIHLLRQQIQLYETQQKNVHNLADAYRVERENLKKYLSQQGFKFTGQGDNAIITNLNHIQGKTKEVEEAFNRFIDLQTKEIPSLGKQWLDYENSIAQVGDTLNNIITDTLEQQKSIYLEGLKKEEESVLDSIKKQIEDVTERYEEQIKKQEEKLKLLDEEIDKENRLLELKQIQDQIDRIKQNKNIEFITEQGERILTYDTAQVANLEQQRAELERQYAQENARKNIEDEIDRLQEAKDAEIKILEEELKTKEEYYNKLIETDTKKWESLITSAQEGTLTFSELMDKWYKDVLKKLKEFGEDVEEQTAKIGQAISFGGSSGSSGSNRVRAGADGKAPKGLSAGTIVETNGGDFLITDVKDDGKYESIKLPKYHEGGIVGGSSNKMIELANKLFNVKPGEILNKSLVGELQIPPQNIVKNFIPNLQNLIGQQASSNGGITFNINEVNVKANNPQEFVNALRHQLIAVT